MSPAPWPRSGTRLGRALDEPFDRERGWTSTETPKNDARSGGRGGALDAIAARLPAHPEVISASLAQCSARHFWHVDQLLALRSRWLPAA